MHRKSTEKASGTLMETQPKGITVFIVLSVKAVNVLGPAHAQNKISRRQKNFLEIHSQIARGIKRDVFIHVSKLCKMNNIMCT
jgi:hypothetical protein